MKMEFDVTKMVEEIVMQAKENQEEFIFETIRPYCENVLQMKINKEELKQILLNSVQKREPCEDCISREQAIRIAEQGQIQGYEWQFKKLCNLPSVTPQQKIGHWILDETDNSITCSKCNCLIWANDIINGEPYYCPNCGAKMEVEE